MSRLAQTFATLAKAGRTALIPYITAGDPEPAATVPFMHALVKAGADILELGIPFSDPMADGPVIQAACERALRHRVSLTNVLEMVAEFRRDNTDTPVVLMGYANPLEVMGYAQFAQRAAKAGVDGVITVDLPPEEAAAVIPEFKRNNLDPVFLLAPTSTDDRIKKICAVASGFVYYVSLKGVTGAATLNTEEVATKLAGIRKHTRLPVGVGFGIRDAETAQRVGRIADAVVVGSAIVKRIAEHQQRPDDAQREIAALIAEMRAALDRRDSSMLNIPAATGAN